MKFKKAIVLLILINLIFCSKIFLKRQKKLNLACHNHGYKYNDICFCDSQYTGKNCEIKKSQNGFFFSDDPCVEVVDRLDHLLNITPQNYDGEDHQFPRLSGTSITGKPESYDNDVNRFWIRMHDIKNNSFKIFGEKISPKDIKQGGIGNCYFLATLASLATIKDGEVIKNMFLTQHDNDKRIYVTRWLYAGKPRYVAVDDWVPGFDNVPQFSEPFRDGGFWPLILEKSWAKIHRNYASTNSGNSLDVLQSIIQARTQFFATSSYDQNNLFYYLQAYLHYGYPMLAVTMSKEEAQYFSSQKQNKLILSHQYSILKAYEVQTDDGKSHRLIQVFNPHNQEKWEDNPWGGKGENWSESMKQKYDVDFMDGAFHLSLQDFQEQFETIEFCENRHDFSIFWQDVPFKKNSSQYQAEFMFKSDNQKEIFIHFQQSLYKLTNEIGCKDYPYSLNYKSLKVTTPSNQTIKDESFTRVIQVTNAVNGKYTINLGVKRNLESFQYFTLTVYAQEGSVKFIDRQDNFKQQEQKECPNKCSGKGLCNFSDGICHCYDNYIDDDCSFKYFQCPNDCNENGECDYETGKCICNPHTFDLDCKLCQDKINCKFDVERGRCESQSETWKKYMEKNCPNSCAKLNIKKFAACLEK